MRIRNLTDLDLIAVALRVSTEGRIVLGVNERECREISVDIKNELAKRHGIDFMGDAEELFNWFVSCAKFTSKETKTISRIYENLDIHPEERVKEFSKKYGGKGGN